MSVSRVWIAQLFSIVILCLSEAEAQSVRIDLHQYGLPADAFAVETQNTCPVQYNSYRFVHWLTSDVVVVGFNENPSCTRVAQSVTGLLKVVSFKKTGTKLAEIELPYDAGPGNLLSENNHAWVGPEGTLVIQTADASSEPSSKLSVISSDLKPLKEIALTDGSSAYGVSFADQSLIIRRQERKKPIPTYEFIRGPSLTSSLWDVDTRPNVSLPRFGTSTAAWQACDFKFTTEKHGDTSISKTDGPPKCELKVEHRDGTSWALALKDGDMADVLGVLRNGDVVAEVGHRRTRSLKLFGPLNTEDLPWDNPSGHDPILAGFTEKFYRFAAFQTNDNSMCEGFGKFCSANGTFLIWDKLQKRPVLRRSFPKNGRAELAPDGTSYASFEDGELRIYKLP